MYHKLLCKREFSLWSHPVQLQLVQLFKLLELSACFLGHPRRDAAFSWAAFRKVRGRVYVVVVAVAVVVVGNWCGTISFCFF